MNKEDIQNLTPAQIEAIVCQLEHQYERLKEEYLQKKTKLLVNDLTLLQHRIVIDNLIKKL